MLSHMRANTSLLGHIFGSNPEVEGYYELHMGYYSWKSLVRQKLLYFSRHAPKNGARFMFDKILHDDHAINLSLFQHAKIIFALRAPERTIPSIISLYRRVEPEHEFATAEGATNYYVGRLASLQQLAQKNPVDFLYMDADALRSNPEQTLSTLTDFVGLRYPLREDYAVQPLTGAEKVGDSSDSIGQGKILKTQRGYPEINLPEALLTQAKQTFQTARNNLIQSQHCRHHILLSTEMWDGRAHGT